MKKTITLLLVLAMLVCALAACKGNNNPPVNTEAPTGGEAPDAPKGPQTYDELTKTDLGDYEFRILTREVNSASVWSNIDWDFDGDPEAETTDLISRAVYKRNVKVENDYNCTITQVGVPNGDLLGTAQMDASTGAGNFDIIVLPFIHQINNMALNGYYYDLTEVNTLNLSDPWWNTSTNDSLALFGHYYTICGDINIIDDMATWIVAFNKYIANDYEMVGNYHYDLVTSGEWTWEKMYENAAIVADDSHERYGDGRYGIVTQYEVAQAYIASAGVMTVIQNQEEGTFSNNIRGNKFESLMSDIYDVLIDDNVQVFGDNDTSCAVFPAVSWGRQANIFKSSDSNSGSLYYIGTVSTYVSAMWADMDDPTGVLPVPKYEKNSQTGYISTLQAGNGTGASIPKYLSAELASKVGTLLTAMSAASMPDDNPANDTLTEAFYDKVLYGRKVKDPDSAAMLDLIFDSRVVDIGIVMSSRVRNVIDQTVKDRGEYGWKGYMDAQVSGLNKDLQDIAYLVQNGFVPREENPS